MLQNNSDVSTIMEMFDYTYDYTEVTYKTTSDILFEIYKGMLVSSGLLADLLIIILMLKKRMRTKTNLIIMNWALNDALFLIAVPSVISPNLETLGIIIKKPFGCIVQNSEFSFVLTSNMCLLVLLSDFLVNSTKLKLKTILFFLYSFTLMVVIFDTVYCNYEINFFSSISPTFFIIAIIFLVLIAMLLTKDIINCFHRNTDKNFRKRLNILKICVYNNIVTVILRAVLRYFSIFRLLGLENLVSMYEICLNSFYVFIYLIFADYDFKISLLNIFKHTADKYDVTITKNDKGNYNLKV